MVSDRLPRKLAAILYADVAGYSRLTGEDEEGTHRRLSAYLDLISTSIGNNGGRVVHYAGDAVLADFDSVADALTCAASIQIDLKAHNEGVPEERRLQFRIGVNLGDVIVDRDDIYGDGVNVAARLESLAEPGGVCISESVRNAIGTRLPLDCEFLGEQKVKNIAEPVRAYHVRLKPGAELPKPRARPTVGKRPANRVVATATLIVVLAIAGGIALWPPWQRGEQTSTSEHTTSPVAEKPSVAVLPLADLTADAEQEYFADGLTDDLITDLSKVSGLLVIARNSVFTYKGKAVEAQQVASELGVNYVLNGSVRRADSRVRINVQLIDATTGRHIWADRYDRDFKDIFALQDEVVSKIVSALAVKLTVSERALLRRNRTDNLEAYDYYLRAKQGAYNYDGEGLADALSLYEKAIALDPSFADAHAGYARAAVDVWRYDVDWVLPGPVARKRAYEAASHALSLDSEIPEAYSVLGVLQMVDSRYDEAIASARKAVSLDSNNAEAYLNLALVLTHSGMHSEAVEAMEAAFRLNPKPAPGAYLLSALVLFMDRQYEKALEMLGKSREAMPANEAVHEQLAMTYAQLGRLDEARTELNKILKNRPWTNLAYLRLFYAYHKRKDDLDHRLEALRKAGMPEWPFGYEGRPEDRLAPDEIMAVTFGRTWVGRGTDGTPFMKQISEDGTLAYRDPSHYLTGVVSIEGGMYCQQFSAILTGRKYCGNIYRNPEGTPEEKNEYVNVSIFRIVNFSLAE